MNEEEALVERVVQSYDADDGMLISMLQDVQAERGYLSADNLRRLAKRLNVPLTRVFGVATFYSAFRLAPKGAHEVTLCMGTVCHLKGAPAVAEAIQDAFEVEAGGTTPDRLFSFQCVNCVGACALAPVMVVDGQYYDGVTPSAALEILRALPAEAVPAEAEGGAR